jgi:hypothetical protein
MRRRLATLPFVVVIVAAVASLGWVGAAQAGSKRLTFQVSDARAYAYKASIPQPVIQGAPKCDPKTEKYKCQGYNHNPNCPKKIDFGPKGRPPDPAPPEGVDGAKGSAGEGAGNNPSGDGVPQAGAVRLNRLFSDGASGRVGDVVQSNGVASLQYVDLGTPPWNGNQDGHTETDAFTNQSNYEERCYPTTKDAKAGTDYAHFFSHSYVSPETIHYSECFETQCQLSAGPLQPTAEHGVTEVHLAQQGDVVRGVLSAQLENLKFPGGFPLTIDELQSYAKFESDGTPDGLRWQVVTTAQGAHFAGQPIALPQGQSIQFGAGDQAVSFGVAGPYVDAPKDGHELHVVAPGMFVATSQQTAFFAGAELTANFGRDSALTFPPIPPPPSSPPSNGGGPGTTTDGGGGPTGNTGGGPSFPTIPSGGGTNTAPLPPSAQQFALISKNDPPWAPIAILAFGTLGFLVALLRWSQQFEWGRRMYEVQPMRSFEWLYRAFLKT